MTATASSSTCSAAHAPDRVGHLRHHLDLHNGTSGTLEALTTTTTIDLPVAEIQTINRPAPTH